jgi:hypothetical protein
MPVSSAGDMAAAAEGAEGKQPSSYDLLIVGPGVLGSYVGKLWLDDHPDVTVVGQTNTTSNHDRCAFTSVSDPTWGALFASSIK